MAISARENNESLWMAAFFFAASTAVAALTVKHGKEDAPKGNLRIVSLCPSTTQTLYDLGLAQYVVGRTQYCPTCDGNKIPAYGGTKNPRWKQIALEARPTHLLFNMEENDFTHLDTQIKEWISPQCQLVIDTPTSIHESRAMVLRLGQIFGVQAKAQQICQEMDQALESLQQVSRRIARRRNKNYDDDVSFTYLYFIWHSPSQRVVGQGTYIGAMLAAAGGQNLANGTMPDGRYPLVPDGYNRVADICLLSTEPYAFSAEHIPLYEKYGRHTYVIDGEMLALHGSRTVQGLQYLKRYLENQLKPLHA